MSKAYLAAHLRKFPPVQRKILVDLREYIESRLPASTQVIKYGFKNHNSIFPYNGSFNARLREELKNYEQTKGSIHFEVEKSIPKLLVKKILDERIKQINALYPKKTGEYLEFYPNGVLKASGKYRKDKLHGDWKWFRKTGVIMRSGSFKNGEQVGTWITYDAKGKIYKKTLMSGV